MAENGWQREFEDRIPPAWRDQRDWPTRKYGSSSATSDSAMIKTRTGAVVYRKPNGRAGG
jgi:hypothetical protein